jgi:hypothetical protein
MKLWLTLRVAGEYGKYRFKQRNHHLRGGATVSPALSVRVENESVWLPQEKIAALFGVQRPAIIQVREYLLGNWSPYRGV